MYRNYRRTPNISEVNKAIVVGVSMIFWLAFGAYVAGQLNFTPARLVLQHDGCTLVQRTGARINPLPDTASCEVTLPFRPNLLNEGGRVNIGDNTYTIPEHQIIGYTKLFDQPYTPYQWQLIYGFLAATALMLFLAFSNKRFTREA